MQDIFCIIYIDSFILCYIIILYVILYFLIQNGGVYDSRRVEGIITKISR